MTKASISNSYRWRPGVMGLALFAMGLWFLYDGAIGYPAQQQVYQQHMEIRQEYGDQWQRPWAELEHEIEGWTENPAERTDLDIWVQYGCAALTLPLGLFFMGVFVRAGWRWIASDEKGIHTNDGRFAAWDAITELDETRWERKGIAIVHYKDGKGHAGRITLDDWKFDQEPINEIYRQVRRQLGLEEPGGETGPGTEKEQPAAEAGAEA